MEKVIKIGTRKSKLALAQTHLFIKALQWHHPALKVEVVEIGTRADSSQKDKVVINGKTQDRALADLGGKRLWTWEFEQLLLDRTIDCAVHSMKDVETTFPEGLGIGCFLPREDVRDAFFSPIAARLQDLPKGAVVGTASPRRGAIIRALRPDLNIQVFRGNVDTRLQKLADREVDATLLAVAGLNRLGIAHLAQEILEPETMLPSAAQGAVGIEIREEDEDLKTLLAPLHCRVTEWRAMAERAFLDVMDGSCKTPLAALMSVPDQSGMATLEVLVAKTDGSDVRRATHTARITCVEDAIALGTRAGQAMQAALPPRFLAAETA